MYTLYADKSEDFKCKISVEGSKISETKARLVIHSANVSLLFEGTIDPDGTCVVPIKKLKNLLAEGETGTMALEVISEDTFFSPWEDDFSVKVNKKVSVVVEQQHQEPVKESRIKVEVMPQAEKSINETKKIETKQPVSDIKHVIKKQVQPVVESKKPAGVKGLTVVKQTKPVVETKKLNEESKSYNINDSEFFKELKIPNFVKK